MFLSYILSTDFHELCREEINTNYDEPTMVINPADVMFFLGAAQLQFLVPEHVASSAQHWPF